MEQIPFSAPKTLRSILRLVLPRDEDWSGHRDVAGAEFTGPYANDPKQLAKVAASIGLPHLDQEYWEDRNTEPAQQSDACETTDNLLE